MAYIKLIHHKVLSVLSEIYLTFIYLLHSCSKILVQATIIYYVDFGDSLLNGSPDLSVAIYNLFSETGLSKPKPDGYLQLATCFCMS